MCTCKQQTRKRVAAFAMLVVTHVHSESHGLDLETDYILLSLSLIHTYLHTLIKIWYLFPQISNVNIYLNTSKNNILLQLILLILN